MIFDSRGSLELPTQIDNVTQAYCLLDLVRFPNAKNTKGIQNEIIYKDAAVVPSPRKLSSAYTEPMRSEYRTNREECNCNICFDRFRKRENSSGSPQLNNINLYKIKTETERPVRKSIISLHHKRRKSYDISSPAILQKKQKIAERQFRRKLKIKKQHQRDSETENHKKILKLFNRQEKKLMKKDIQNARTKVKFEIKPKHGKAQMNTCRCPKTYDVRFDKGDTGSFDVKKVKSILKHKLDSKGNALKSHYNTCAEGVCEDATKNKNYKFVCKCITRKQKPVPIECTDITCNESAKPANNKKLVQMKEKITCLCHKYSQKLKPVNSNPVTNSILREGTCENGLCKEALRNKEENFRCKCNKKSIINECTDKTCSINNKTYEYGRKLSPKSKIMQTNISEQYNKPTYFTENDNQIIQNISKPERMLKKRKNNAHLKKSFQNEIDQTGEPFFEMKVNSLDMCLLNSGEVRNKVMTLGNMDRKKQSCICPSHKKVLDYFNNNSMCSAGPCEKAFKNKKTNFTCKCLENKFKECTNTTCKAHKKCFTRRRRDNRKDLKTASLPIKYNNPLFEVKLNSDNMCILNSKDIHDKIIDIEKQSKGDAKEICASGICSKAKKKDKYICICRCVGQKHNPEALECSDITCAQTPSKCFLSRMCNKYRRKNRTKAIRGDIDTTKIQDIKSKISCICAQIISKSDNWTTKHIRRKKSKIPLSWCKLLCTRSETDHHDKEGLKKSINRKDLTVREHDKTKTIRKKHEPVRPIKTSVSRCSAITSKGGGKKINLRSNKCVRCIYKRSCRILRCKSFICHSISNLRNRHKYTINDPVKKENNEKRKKIRIRKNPESKSVETPISKCGLLSCKRKQGSDKCVCCKCRGLCEILKCQSFICKSISSLRCRRKYTVNKTKNIHRRKTVSLSIGKLQRRKDGQKTNSKDTKLKEKEKKLSERIKAQNQIKKLNIAQKQIKEKKKSESKQKLKMKIGEKERKKAERLKTQNKKKSRSVSEKRIKASIAVEKKFEKERQKKEKIETKKHNKIRKQQIKELEAVNAGKEELHETSCIADFFMGLLKVVVNTCRGLVSVIFQLIFKPEQSYRYIKLRLKDPLGTYERLKKWFRDTWHLKKMQMAKTMGGSETMNVLSDTFQDTPLFQAFAHKGKTKKEKKEIELRNKERQRRIRKRKGEALYGCRHMLLTTLRKTPCLWVYHICPDMYPQCLNLLTFLRNFSHLLLFCVAFLCWTPCIATFELCRAFLCCFLCTQ